MGGFSYLLLSSKRAERHPLGLFVWAFFYASLSLWISLWLLPEYASIFMIVFTLFSCIYVMQKIIIREEHYEHNLFSEHALLKKHGRALTAFLALFMGFLFAYSFWAMVLSEGLFIDAFKFQTQTVEGIRSMTGNSTSNLPLMLIFLNNLKVAFLSFFLAMFYGAGAVLILAWNASVMGAVIGGLLRNYSAIFAPVVFLKYLLHGIPEMLAYFTAALAGGIIFITFMRGDFEREQFKRTLLDVVILLGITLAILVFAAVVEVYVSAKI